MKCAVVHLRNFQHKLHVHTYIHVHVCQPDDIISIVYKLVPCALQDSLHSSFARSKQTFKQDCSVTGLPVSRMLRMSEANGDIHVQASHSANKVSSPVGKHNCNYALLRKPLFHQCLVVQYLSNGLLCIECSCAPNYS